MGQSRVRLRGAPRLRRSRANRGRSRAAPGCPTTAANAASVLWRLIRTEKLSAILRTSCRRSILRGSMLYYGITEQFEEEGQVFHDVAMEEPPRFQSKPPRPFHADALNPAGRPPRTSRDDREASAQSEKPRGGQVLAKCADHHLLLWETEARVNEIRFGRTKGVADFRHLERITLEAVRRTHDSGDPQIRVEPFENRGCRFRIARVATEQE